MKNMGIIYALSAYFLWGLAPLYWYLLQHVPSTEIVAHRMLWSSVVAVLATIIMGQWRELVILTKQPKIMLQLLCASVLISVNWGVFIWAVNNGYAIEASMGYFINPLVNVLFGVLIFHERLRMNQWLAILLALVGVVYLVVTHGTVPVVALTLAFSFSTYAAIKKTLKVPAVLGLAIEASLVAVPALLYVLFITNDTQVVMGGDVNTAALLICAGFVTLAPLLLFAAAAKTVSMTALGMSQFLGPTMQLIIAIWIFLEPFGTEKLVAFGFIWMGLLFYIVDQLSNRRQRRAMEGTAGVVVKRE